MRQLLLAFALTLGIAAPLAAQVARSADLQSIEAGVICPPESVGYREAPGTITGRAHIIEEMPEFVSLTQMVPAVIGVGFGVRLQAVPELGTETVVVTITHPPMGKDGVRQQSFTSAVSGLGPTIAFFQFDHAYEMVLGRWSFEARRDDQLVYRAFFDVVPPQSVPQLADICNYRDLLS